MRASSTAHLVGFDGCDLLVCLDKVALLLEPLLEGSLGDGLGHARDLDELLLAGPARSMERAGSVDGENRSRRRQAAESGGSRSRRGGARRDELAARGEGESPLGRLEGRCPGREHGCKGNARRERAKRPHSPSLLPQFTRLQPCTRSWEGGNAVYSPTKRLPCAPAQSCPRCRVNYARLALPIATRQSAVQEPPSIITELLRVTADTLTGIAAKGARHRATCQPTGDATLALLAQAQSTP